MKNQMRILIALFFIFGIGSIANAQTAVKIGYVDSRAVSDKLPEVKQAYAQLSEFQKQKQNELQKEEEAFQKEVEKYQQDGQGMDAAMRASKERELQAKNEQLQLKATNAQADIQKRQQTIFDPIEKRIQEAITAVANENGYTYVLAKEVLLHSPAGDDISDLVAKKLLASSPTSNNNQKPAGATTTPANNQKPANTPAPKK
ncbi:OmpH family outer membrane protein [Rhodocytophaga aerolata]|uniref:OmpH family outer membrane protein n=1 Tax=Rhodocytophaga aerolata TaxID=455078 RepID=A0ABT8RDI4_9BACT|nr:OmpH family outer membrane protein [Rhodocytophaga aerolata]MDO1448812.1 OmpH family outer membrane protein [Rhodocytophaga aerolata]